MLKKMLTGALAASAMAVPLAAVAWADPPPNPNPPAVPNPLNPNPPATPESYGQGPMNPATPAVSGPNGQGPTCVVSANPPAQGATAQGTSAEGTSAEGTPATTWRQVATLQGSVASDLGLPSGQTMKVFCAPAGTPNPQGQPASLQTPGQTNPAQTPVQNQLGPVGPQNTAPGQQ
jgi:hypothetical protein